MSQKNKKTVKSVENWFKNAYNNLPKSQITTTRDKICIECECSEKTFYRWMQKGFIPSHRDLIIICKILNLDLMTRQPLLKQDENK